MKTGKNGKPDAPVARGPGDAGGAPAEPARQDGAGEVWQPRAGSGAGPRAIASLIPRITEKSFEKHGFAAASLIMDWPAIVGSALARLTRPLQLKWPRRIDKRTEAAAEDVGRPGATLVLQVDPAAALDVEYQAAQIKDRINTYFGYRAVADLKLVQEPLFAAGAQDAPEPRPHALVPPQADLSDRAGARGADPDGARTGGEATDAAAASSEADPLAAALARLGEHVASAAKRPR